ncbi:hypothetical protein BDV93DRAFT_611784 [Ceratobasidium sp. AG-I]|nr:hypothetical protein BDV93DRAFT_611784 [Ceratobasidium sp. AG-I]
MAEPLSLNSAILGSDDEDDDYVPGEQDSGSDSEVERHAKKQRVQDLPSEVVAKNPVTDDAARNALWESFLESASTSASGSGVPTPQSEAKTITIDRSYRFAGQDVVEKVEVAEDSKEAKEWRSRQLSPRITPENASTATSPSKLDTPAPSTHQVEPLLSSSVDTPVVAPPAVAPKPKVATKPRKSLSSLAAAAKPKKLTTLEKSRLDWQSHVSAATLDERDELERNRKAGGTGYLQKVDFLARVGERRENAFEDSKRKRR